MKLQASWIAPPVPTGEACPIYSRSFSLRGTVRAAQLCVTALGVYHAELNGKPVSSAVLMPGWTAYHTRLQVQRYDVTALLAAENQLRIGVGRGWYRSRLAGWSDAPAEEKRRLAETPPALLCELHITYADGSEERIASAPDWQVLTGLVRESSLYDGEFADAAVGETLLGNAVCVDGPDETLIEQQGALICEQERIAPRRIFRTPKGELVVDFGQNLTGYVELHLCAQKGARVELSHGEVLDAAGNFYNANYRSAKAKLVYICRDGEQTYHPLYTFFGFRYIRLDAFPCEPTPENFTAIVVHSDMKRTGRVRSSSALLNQLFDNILWGQKGNFLDVPTDCPQRDERLGWTGDAQAFIKTACYQYDVERFFTKWLADMAADQREDGAIPHIIPRVPWLGAGSAAWADAATICPWQIYEFYGDKALLRSQFDTMKGHLRYIASVTKDEYLWTGDVHFGDWLALDIPDGAYPEAANGIYKGASRDDLIASAFYAYSTALVIKAGHVLGEDVTAYERLYQNIVQAFRAAFPDYRTQTELVLALHFGLAADVPAAVAQLVQLIQNAGNALQTGFVGTPYLLHVLSDNGQTALAYQLLLRTEYPSWLYPVLHGATTCWEHWDSQKPDGSFWSTDMNSFNHYAYGAVLDWVYEKALGIQNAAGSAGFARLRIAPQPSTQLQWLEGSLDTRHGTVRVGWQNCEGRLRYTLSLPVEAEVCLDGTTKLLGAGEYVFFTELPTA